MTLDAKEQRRILGKFATGVTVASTKVGDETWGMTANAVTSLSLDPPLVILCIQKEGQSRSKFEEGGCFALNILSEDQQEISDRFAFKGPKDFSDLETTTAVTGAPAAAATLMVPLTARFAVFQVIICPGVCETMLKPPL